MSCMSGKCKYLRFKFIKKKKNAAGNKYFKSFPVFECALGERGSNKKDMRCKFYKKIGG